MFIVDWIYKNICGGPFGFVVYIWTAYGKWMKCSHWDFLFGCTVIHKLFVWIRLASDTVCVCVCACWCGWLWVAWMRAPLRQNIVHTCFRSQRVQMFLNRRAFPFPCRTTTLQSLFPLAALPLLSVALSSINYLQWLFRSRFFNISFLLLTFHTFHLASLFHICSEFFSSLRFIFMLDIWIFAIHVGCRAAIFSLRQMCVL